MKIRIVDDTLSPRGLSHTLPIGIVTEAHYEDDGYLYAPVLDGHIVIMGSNQDIPYHLMDNVPYEDQYGDVQYHLVMTNIDNLKETE